ncbi:TetR/AcrR family transcriptional regulator [Mycobacterium sp. GA-2829]|uniref:TetR/AcrR family transcriptional regulator n=1 Tax=Mycobacterium sp. GA-2829 TaxID=1772283 RepID=UPI00073FF6BB|nr:TetR/AcrR family transcriptional regulator [Mycobacterium sp. GA-2829]KUI35527.1 TetR family transcriptional regulator [Mycobacterium sp. GA-2829]
MPRPRVIDLDPLLDAAEQLAAESGPRAVTIRALSARTEVSNGAIYHAFGSRGGLLGRVWLRAARRYLDEQRKALDANTSAVEAVVAAADCPATFLDRHPASARYLLALSRDELLGSGELPAPLADELRTLDAELTALLVDLTERMWGRRDRNAVAAIRTCVVELPTALLIHGPQPPGLAARERLAAAVRAVLALTPPTPKPTVKEPI